jgi:tousled-like kinase
VNILFDENGGTKITDFGLSSESSLADAATTLELTSQGAGMYWYLPPECFIVDQSVRISNKVDVWAIGVIFYQMLYGRRPFGEGMTQDRILSDRTMLGARTVPFPDEGRVGGGAVVSPEARDFVRACLRYDQADRPTIAQLCEHPYVLSLPLSPPSRIAPS